MLFKKHFSLTILLAIILMTSFSFMSTASNEITYNLVKNEYIHPVESFEEANQIALDYHINLVSYSEYGYALYQNEVYSSSFMLDHDFYFNTYSVINAPAWKTSTEDEYLSQQYGLEITNTIDAWTYTTGTSNILIAIIDTGIDTSHPEFSGRISPYSKNIVTNEIGLSAIEDDYGHGTMVAGIIAANKDNSEGIAGITQNTSLLIIKTNVTNEDSFKDSDLIEAIYYAIEQGADIINLSLGSNYANPQTEEAIKAATQSGIVVVGASGNEGTDELMYPASFEECISVGAVDEDMEIAIYSSFNDAVDLTAPGSDIITTSMNSGYVMGSGTSFAAPHVSGIIALYMSLYPNATINEIKQKLYATALDLGDNSLDPYYGYGLIDANKLFSTSFYEVSFETIPGSYLDSLYIIDGSYLIDTETPVLDNQVFVGWYIDSNRTIPFDYNLPITSDITLYALYSDSYHTVRFITEGSAVDDLIVEHLDTFSLPSSSLAGSNFIAWYLDENYETEYVQQIVVSDLTLYAKFQEIVYYQINYYVDQTLYHNVSIESGQEIPEYLITLEGYEFAGWYLDMEYTMPFDDLTISSNLDLYAKLNINYFQITLNIEQSSSFLQVEYNTLPIIDIPLSETQTFAGWYLDEGFINLYTLAPVTENFELYAKFVDSVHTINLWIGDNHYDTIYIESLDPFVMPIIDIDGYVFKGWYLDSSYTEEYIPSIITENITIYGLYEEEQYSINFYDGLGNIISSSSQSYGEIIIYPQNPTRPSTISFDYNFLSWSETDVTVMESLEFYPVFERTFIENSVTLNPSIDTITVGEQYLDSSINLLDSTLTLEIDSDLDNSLPGKYIVNYMLYDKEELVYTINRYIRVIEATPSVEITLNAGVSTIYLGQSYIESGATSTIGEVIISGEVNPMVAGVYYITYQVEYMNQIYTKTRVVTVLDTSVLTTIVTLSQLTFKEDEYEKN
ncbi:MAG: S8 family serine peptidase [Tenericutes bacterium]|nr:S8 family serine peptidase [Mycoplasmatota bacterium]